MPGASLSSLLNLKPTEEHKAVDNVSTKLRPSVLKVRPASEKVRSEDMLDAGTPKSPRARTDSLGQEALWLS
jgi:hypothetical protein